MSAEREEESDPTIPLPISGIDEDSLGFMDAPLTDYTLSPTDTTTAAQHTTSGQHLSTYEDTMKNPDPAKANLLPTEPIPPKPKPKTYQRVVPIVVSIALVASGIAWYVGRWFR